MDSKIVSRISALAFAPMLSLALSGSGASMQSKPFPYIANQNAWQAPVHSPLKNHPLIRISLPPIPEKIKAKFPEYSKMLHDIHIMPTKFAGKGKYAFALNTSVHIIIPAENNSGFTKSFELPVANTLFFSIEDMLPKTAYYTDFNKDGWLDIALKSEKTGIILLNQGLEAQSAGNISLIVPHFGPAIIMTSIN